MSNIISVASGGNIIKIAVKGTQGAPGISGTVQNATTGSVNQVVTDSLIKCDTTNGDISVILLNASAWSGRTLSIKKTVSANKVTLVPFGVQKLDEESLPLEFFNRNESISIMSDGATVLISSSHRPQDRNVSTGVITGCVVSPNGTTKFDISPGTIAIEDWSNPLEMRLKLLSYEGVIGQLPDNPLTNIFTTVRLEESGTEGIAQLILEGDGQFSNTTRRNSAALRVPIHPNGDGEIVAFTEDYQLAYGWLQAMQDMQICRRACVEGNLITPNGANLSVNRSSGKTSLPFFNAAQSTWIEAATRNNVAQEVQLFARQAQDPAGPFVTGLVATIDPDNWDNNGVLTPLSNNNWTIQRVFWFGQSNTMSIGYGQNVYSQKSIAVASIDKEIFIDPLNAVTGVWIASIIVKKGATDLSNITDNEIINRQHL